MPQPVAPPQPQGAAAGLGLGPSSSASASSSSTSSMPREAMRPYRYGMTLLCFGGLLNWLGLFENYAEPVRYVGVACVVSGALLLCFAICCWIRPGARRQQMQRLQLQRTQQEQTEDPVHVIAVSARSASIALAAAQKPPDYETVTDKPPSYDDAIKLSPALLWLADEQERHARQLEQPPPQLQPQLEQQQQQLEQPPPPPPPPPHQQEVVADDVDKGETVAAEGSASHTR